MHPCGTSIRRRTLSKQKAGVRDGNRRGIGEKRGTFRENCGDFRGKVGRFSPVGGECLLHLGGNDGGLAAKGERKERKPRNTGQNGTKKYRRCLI